jgi:hypothetical protein
LGRSLPNNPPKPPNPPKVTSETVPNLGALRSR